MSELSRYSLHLDDRLFHRPLSRERGVRVVRKEDREAAWRHRHPGRRAVGEEHDVLLLVERAVGRRRTSPAASIRSARRPRSCTGCRCSGGGPRAARLPRRARPCDRSTDTADRRRSRGGLARATEIRRRRGTRKRARRPDAGGVAVAEGGVSRIIARIIAPGLRAPNDRGRRPGIETTATTS